MAVLRTTTLKYLVIQVLISSTFFLWGQTPVSREYQVKAVFLFNFVQFVEWPPSVFPEEGTPLVIGILGDDPFGNYLDQAILNEKVNNHSLIIQHYKNAAEVKMCHILFVNLSDAGQLEQTFKSLKGQNILTVGEGSKFIRYGGIIRFFNENDKIKFQINVEAAKAADLNISSKLLRLAEIVNPKTN